MLDFIYPEEEQRFFTNREHLLAVLGLSLDLLNQGIRKHLALSGFRRVGKTVILKEFLRRKLLNNDSALDEMNHQPLIAYIDLPRLAFTPEAFAVQYVGNLLYWFVGNPQIRVESLLNPPDQLALAGQLGLAEFTDHIIRLHQELQKEHPDQHLLLEMAFNAPDVYALAARRRVLLLLDEFPDLLALNNFPQVKDVLSLFRAVLQSQSRVGYVVAGSMISLMERIFLEAESPLFVHFQTEIVGPFGRDDCDTLARHRLSILALEIQSDVLAAVYQVTRGHPFYIYATCMRVIENVSLLQKPLTAETVREAFTLETLGSTGRIYNLCRYVLEQSLQGVRGETVPQAILQVLAQEPAGMSLAEVSARLKRPTGAIRNILAWLVDVDLVEQRDDKTYSFRDPVLQVWVAYYYSGLQLTGMPNQKILTHLVADLMERYERVANELGLAKESQVRELLQAFSGQTVDGRIFGRPGQLRLPTFVRVAPYLSPDGQVQIDAVAQEDGLHGERWVVEIKWRGRLTGRKELEKLANNAQALSAQAWFISKAGFTQDALDFARQVGVYMSSQAEFEALAKLMFPKRL
jgi:uncharacterized protein